MKVAHVADEAAKNNHALSIMEKILDGAVWINIHQLPVCEFFYFFDFATNGTHK
jgi:hypothetical protein